MRIQAHLDIDVVAVETDAEVSVLVDLTAPHARPAAHRQPQPARTLQVVLDRSGSMSGDRIDGAITALLALVDRLDPADNFGLVAFDDRVELTVPAGPLTDKTTVRRAITRLTARGNTDLSAGYLRGLQEARRVAGPAGATLLLVSDGHANAGITDPSALGSISADAHRRGLVTSTLGYGLGYDERLLSAIARGGSGNELFAEEPDTATALIAAEVTWLLGQTVQAASLLIRLSQHVRSMRVVNDLPVSAVSPTETVVELGGLYSGETRKLILTFAVPAVAALGLTSVATLEFTYLALPTLEQHTVTMPLHVNVVPGDQAAGRIPNPEVRTETLYLQVQRAKRSASFNFGFGDVPAALADLSSARSALDEALTVAPEPLRATLAEESAALDYLTRQASHGSPARAAKYASMDAHYKTFKRGRVRPQETTPDIEPSED